MLANKKNRKEEEKKAGGVIGAIRGIGIITIIALIFDIGMLIYLITKVGIFG